MQRKEMMGLKGIDRIRGIVSEEYRSKSSMRLESLTHDAVATGLLMEQNRILMDIKELLEEAAVETRRI